MSEKLDKKPEVNTPEENLENVFEGAVNWNRFGGTNWQTPYKRDFCKRLVQYFNVGLGKFVASGIAGEKFVPETPPHFSKFARKIGVTEKTLYEWTEIYPEFKVAMDMANEMRNEVLKDNSLLGNYDTKIAAMFIHHYTEIKDKAVPPPIPQGLPIVFIDGINRFLEQRGEKPIALPGIEDAEVVEVQTEVAKDFKKFREEKK
mgnify:CR=1 FL=1